MPNTEYTACMTKTMRDIPKGISKEERSAAFCVGAKLCSGKAKDENEARKLCANREPSAPRGGGGGGSRKKLDAEGIAACVLPQLSQVKTLSVQQLARFIADCSGKSGGKKIKRPETKSHFIGKCAMENAIKGTREETAKLRRECEQLWKERLGEVTSGV